MDDSIETIRYERIIQELKEIKELLKPKENKNKMTNKDWEKLMETNFSE